MHPLLPAILGLGANQGYAMHHILQDKPVKDAAIGDVPERLVEGMDKRVNEIAPGQVNNVVLTANQPDPDMQKRLQQLSGSQFGSHTVAPINGKEYDLVNYNPNASSEILAHELGHGASFKTKRGRQVRMLRGKLQQNPKLATAIGAAVVGVPIIQAALQKGDDDIVEGIAIASLLNSPTLIDEALASKNALAIMDQAGMKANLGQRSRLAGAFLSYASAPIMAGLMGNAIGNVADDYTGLYDL